MKESRYWLNKIRKRLRIDKDNKIYFYRCMECGETNETAYLTVDHIHPRFLGGNNDIINLQILCQKCNRKKGCKVLN
jgi:5-methylcytosine-specific restriction endonuclease McrA